MRTVIIFFFALQVMVVFCQPTGDKGKGGEMIGAMKDKGGVMKGKGGDMKGPMKDNCDDTKGEKKDKGENMKVPMKDKGKDIKVTMTDKVGDMKGATKDKGKDVKVVMTDKVDHMKGTMKGKVDDIKGTVSKVSDAKDGMMAMVTGALKGMDISKFQKYMDDQYNKMKNYMGVLGKMKAAMKTNPEGFKDMYETMSKEMKSAQKVMPGKVMGMLKSKMGSMINMDEAKSFMQACSKMMKAIKKDDMAKQMDEGIKMMTTAYDTVKAEEVPDIKTTEDMMAYAKKSGFSESVTKMESMYKSGKTDYETLKGMNIMSMFKV